MTRIPADEYAEIVNVVERAARRASFKFGLSESDSEEVYAVALAEAGKAWTRWAWDGVTPLAGFIAEPVKWAVWHACQEIVERDQTAASDDLLASEVGEGDAEQLWRRGRIAARLEALASQWRCVAIFLALEAGETPRDVATRFPHERTGKPLAYVLLRAAEREGRGRLACDPELRELMGQPEFEPAELTPWEVAMLALPVDLPVEEDRHVPVNAPAQSPMPSGAVATDVAVLVGMWARWAVAVGLAVRLARLGVRYGPARAAPS